MLDFLMIATKSNKSGVIEIYPKFIIKKSSDLMIRGGDFYAIWVDDKGLWSTDEQDALRLIDRELDIYVKENKNRFNAYKVSYMWDAESGMIDTWHKYCQKQLRDNFNMLDEELIFTNTKTTKKDYASKRLSYPLEKGDITAYNRLMSIIYDEKERKKIEWAIGSILTGDSKRIQKFLVLYGSAGTGKSTVLNIIQQLFEGYYSVFDAKALGSASNSFALESFKTNPLVAIQHDGDLSKIEDNTRLNSLVSHELMTVNEKFKSAYSNRFKAFLFMGTNKPVRITDAKSGLIRRLIDVSPSGNKLSINEYNRIMEQIPFELGAIAYHCRQIYLDNVNFYDSYIPMSMLGASNDFYNFVVDSYDIFKENNSTTLKTAWEMYKNYVEYAKVNFPFSQRIFKEELKNYFRDYDERYRLDDGTRIRSYYYNFQLDKLEKIEPENKDEIIPVIDFKEQKSILDEYLKDAKAQYANEDEKPMYKWDSVKTKLEDLDTSRLHYLQGNRNHIVIDFDLKDGDGKKNFKLNLLAASKFPTTYAEISKGGNGIHLHYIYEGDVEKLASLYDIDIEIKKFIGNSSLRRKLTKCNNKKIAIINSGLPLKEGKNMLDVKTLNSEKSLRDLIKRNLNKEIHPGTKPSIDFIYKILEDANKNGIKYDITDMRSGILNFAMNSSHQADYCLKLVNKMKFKSEEVEYTYAKKEDTPIVFYDVEVFPNLFVVVYKFRGKDYKPIKLINPKPIDIENLLKYNLIGFNCRKYDNHILYGRLLGYSNEQLYNLSQNIIAGKNNVMFGEAYNLSYTDIYDFSSDKKSLKKFEIELGIHHQELGLPWDEPVSEDLWDKVADYCINDVIATEAVFENRQSDFLAREILATLAGGTVNDTTNSLTTKIIFGNNKHPQDEFNYRFMGVEADDVIPPFLNPDYKDYLVFDEMGRPEFPDYKYEFGKSTYRGEEIGEGGYVYAEPGIYGNVALLDIASMHPTSIINENLFGDEYTKRFKDIVDARLSIKHGDYDKARSMLDGALKPYLEDETKAKDLANALKIAINSVYGLTSAKFENPFRDIRNVDNIVAKRGALFMVNLKHAVQKKGFKVAHIKTDSIKIPDATQEIIDFVMEFGKKYGYTFEHEATYDRMCLVNDAVYIAKYKDGKNAGKWTATGTQFAVPYVFKTLFSKEEIEFNDLCETKSVTTAMYLDMNEGNEDEHNYHFIGRVGRFCPIKDGFGGGILYRIKDDKYYAVGGTKGYRWLESEVVENLNKKDDIDISYYEKLVDDAKMAIVVHGDFDWFISDEVYIEPDYIDGKPVYKEEMKYRD